MSIVDSKRAGAERTEAQDQDSDDSEPLPNYNDIPPIAPENVVQGGPYGHGPPVQAPNRPELGASEEVPPAYSEEHDRLTLHQAGFDAGATLTSDGRINISVNQTSRKLADILAPTIRNQLAQDARIAAQSPLPPAYIPPSLGGRPGQVPPPALNVVIQIVGSRGDVQPFISLGQVLKNVYGHRVRVATHATFKPFVEENGLEFFCIGGDPAELMAFMVKHPGLMPGFDAVKSGEVTKRRKGIEQIIWGCWRSCIEAGDGTGPPPRLERRNSPSGVDAASLFIDTSAKPFVADAIIANPPSFAHIHVAEKLGVPLHLMFTMPWSPTKAFPQPLANIQSSNVDPVTTNFLSYALVEMMTWQGLGDIINRFRTKILDLDPLSMIWAPGVLTRLRIPYTYCWSPALIPKPNDWGIHIDVAGFYFLNLASNFTPDPDLAKFLQDGPPPIYIGFGSIVVDDPNSLTKTIFEAVEQAGVRALVSKGWGGIGADSLGIPEGVFMLGNVPHDWLFEHVSAVCHHGGAGTTAAGIKAGKPTIVVPFFGDQPFWGAMVARAGAGPEPIPNKKLTTATLTDAIRFVMKPDTQARAQELGAKIREEKGADVGVQSFHQHLDVDKYRCTLAPSRIAVWRVRRAKVQLSALAAACLVQSGLIQWSDLKLFRGKEYNTEEEPWDPISAATAALVSDMSTIGLSIADIPRDLFKSIKRPNKKAQPEEKPEPSNEAQRPKTHSQDSAKSVATSHAGEDLKEASGGASQERTVSGDSSRPASERDRSASSSSQQKPPRNMNETIERALGAGKSINTIVSTGMRSPMTFTLGLARGFRNAPKLYNDETVRPPEKVKDLSSGLRVAGKEFGFGMYDGISGLVTHPMKGAQKEGAVGLLKGFGKGIGGLGLKTAAGFWSLPAYTMAGVNAEIRSRFAQSAENYIVASRIAQGKEDIRDSVSQERQDIESRWLAKKDELKAFYTWKSKAKGKNTEVSPAGLERAPVPANTAVAADGQSKTGWLHTRNLPFEERKRLHEQKDAWKQSHPVSLSAEEPSQPRGGTQEDTDDELEHAIQNAVQETSRGDAMDDVRIEQAIRKSVATLRRNSILDTQANASLSSTSSDRGPADRKQSMPSQPANSANVSADIKPRVPYSAENLDPDLEGITEEEYQALIEHAMQLSVLDEQRSRGQSQDKVGGDEEEQYQLALQRSQKENAATPPSDEDGDDFKRAIEASRAHEDNEDLQKAIEASRVEEENDNEEEQLRQAIEESQRTHQDNKARVESLRNEEEIVMEYVKKQSLAEEEHRRKGKGAEEDGANDEELRKALRESLRRGDHDDGEGSSYQ